MFFSSSEPLYIDDLENMLDEGIESAFNAILDDGSVEEVCLILYDTLMVQLLEF